MNQAIPKYGIDASLALNFTLLETVDTKMLDRTVLMSEYLIV